MRFFRTFFILAAALLVLAASRSSRAADTLSIDIFGPGQTAINLFQARPMSGDSGAGLPQEAGTLDAHIRTNLAFVPFFNPVLGADLLEEGRLAGFRGADLDFRKLRLGKVDLLLTTGWVAPNAVELRAYEVFTGRLVVGKAYTLAGPDQTGQVATRFCSALMEALTGKGGFFTSRIAFARKTGRVKEVFTVSAVGGNGRRETDLGGISTSPAWSVDGRRIVFVHMDGTTHRLGVVRPDTGEVELHGVPGNTCISPAFLPSGELTVSLNPEGTPNIYQVDGDFGIEAPLARSWAIDISPSYDRDGRQMCFVSSRLGNPHIFLKNLQTGKTRRITYDGTYNTSPALSPDGKLVAFSRQTGDGHRIFVHELETGRERQVSFGPGNDEEPTWSPDNYFLAFSSDRTGTYKLYVTTRHGDKARQIPTGEGSATTPSWGPAVPQ
jgi:TolB protein